MRFSERGQTSTEYAIILGLITVTIIAAIAVLSTNIGGAYDNTINIVNSAF